MSIGARLKELRMRKNKSLQEVADAVGASKAHIWELERGGAKNPSLELLTKLSGFFDVTVAYLIGEQIPGTEEQLSVFYRDFKDLGDADREMIRRMMKHLKDKKD
jgi:transcriptional regulator with XRE-family HTH domain